MLPLRLSLEGFLSYRDRTEFDFEGARLWMLSGANGAGKSTVFDALRFALYGTHRAGKQNAELLIHHESGRLRVEADIQLGDDVFRLVRTVGRGGARATWQVRQKTGDGWADVPETAMKTDYERWVSQNIGLSDEAFCSSVYLSQGKSDAILNPDPQARFDLLSQLVDLRVYEGWHERALEKRGVARGAWTEAKRRWELSPLPDADALEEKQQQARLAHERIEFLSAKIRELEAWEGDAGRWTNWNGQREKLLEQAAQSRLLLAEGAAIARDFARFAWLERHLPALLAFVEGAEREAELSSRLADLRARLAEAQRRWMDGESAFQNASQRQQEATSRTQEAADFLAALELEHAQLAPQEAELVRWQRLEAEADETRRQLEELEKRDLGDDALARLRASLDEAQQAKRHLPIWRRFAGSRVRWQSERENEASAASRLEEINARLQGGRARLEELTLAFQSTESEYVRERENYVRAKSVYEAAQSALSDFSLVEGEARCHFCGQEVTPEHARAEHARLESEVARACSELESAKAHQEAAKKARLGAENLVKGAGETLAALERELAGARLKWAQHTERRDAAFSGLQSAWGELEGARRALWGDENFDFALSSPRPEQRDFEVWESATLDVKTREQALSEAIVARDEAAQLRRENARIERDLAPLAAKWNDEAAGLWRERWNAVSQEIKAASGALKNAREAAGKSKDATQEIAKSRDAARVARDELGVQIGPLEGEANALLWAQNAAWPSIREMFEEARGHNIGGKSVDGWESFSGVEWRVLDGEWRVLHSELRDSAIEEREKQLRQARAEVGRIENEVGFLSRQMDEVSPDARRSPDELREQKKRFGDELEEATETGRELRGEVARMEQETRQRAQLERDMAEREREFKRWEELEHLLGPRQLQRHLLREAERGIVREANRVLEAISGGTLRLETRVESDEPGQKTPQVLDVLCFHLSGGEISPPIPPAFLSGSQRFRVAVALALGIGRTAARGGTSGHTARAETILIDEGFGSLDQSGRDEMRDELRVLGRELGRIILVSHQEDFASAFPARFDISLEAGVSRARRVVE